MHDSLFIKIMLLLLAVLCSGCYTQDGAAESKIELIVGEASVYKAIKSGNPVEAICVFRQSPLSKNNNQHMIECVQGEDIELRYIIAVWSRSGVFLVDSDSNVGVRVPANESWEVVNDQGLSLGKIFTERDAPDRDLPQVYFNTGLRWRFFEGYDKGKFDSNTLDGRVLSINTIKLPFSQLEIKEPWGTIHVPISFFASYYDVERKKFGTLEDQWFLKIVFKTKN